jgi:hypothetical protein
LAFLLLVSQTSTIFLHQKTPTFCSSVTLLFQIVAGFSITLQWGVEFVNSRSLGSAGFTLEHYWSFLTALFSFAEEALAFGCLTNSWTLLLFVLTNVSNFFSTGRGQASSSSRAVL